MIPPELATSAAYPFPLDARVSPKLKAKIIAGEFVNFAELLDPKKAESNKLSLKASDEGHLVIVKDPGVVSFTQSVKSIVEWDRAFAIYSTVYATSHPLEIAQLLKYGERVKKISAQGGDWCYYDVGFRCRLSKGAVVATLASCPFRAATGCQKVSSPDTTQDELATDLVATSMRAQNVARAIRPTDAKLRQGGVNRPAAAGVIPSLPRRFFFNLLGYTRARHWNAHHFPDLEKARRLS